VKLDVFFGCFETLYEPLSPNSSISSFVCFLLEHARMLFVFALKKLLRVSLGAVCKSDERSSIFHLSAQIATTTEIALNGCFLAASTSPNCFSYFMFCDHCLYEHQVLNVSLPSHCLTPYDPRPFLFVNVCLFVCLFVVCLFVGWLVG